MASFRPFLLLTTQRSGSSVLRRTLDWHPEIWVKGELIHEGSASKYSYSQVLKHSILERTARRAVPGWALRRFLDKAVAPRKGIAAAGFKLMYSQISAVVRNWIDAKPEMHFVHLVRDNRLKSQISIAGVRSHGRYAVKRNDSFEFVPIHLPVESLLQDLEEMDQRIEQHRQWVAGRRHLEVHYEDFQAAPERLLDEIRSFLGADRVEPWGGERDLGEMPLRKITPEAPSEALSNYPEVARVLEGTPYERFLA